MKVKKEREFLGNGFHEVDEGQKREEVFWERGFIRSMKAKNWRGKSKVVFQK
ncbi:hypothetical protein ABE288_18605 [Bacillus salipaludis]|uniref:hypothetical protein n=1 Tax=Bacillus salipaludis TaxID=2547811 RepID=UPI003D23A85B